MTNCIWPLAQLEFAMEDKFQVWVSKYVVAQWNLRKLFRVSLWRHSCTTPPGTRDEYCFENFLVVLWDSVSGDWYFPQSYIFLSSCITKEALYKTIPLEYLEVPFPSWINKSMFMYSVAMLSQAWCLYFCLWWSINMKVQLLWDLWQVTLPSQCTILF